MSASYESQSSSGTLFACSSWPAALGCDSRSAPSSVIAINKWPLESITVFVTCDVRAEKAEASLAELGLELVMKAHDYVQVLSDKGLPSEELEGAWDRFYSAHNPFVLRAVEDYSHFAGTDKDDCVQEVWLEIIRCLGRRTYRPHLGRFCCWFSAVARNKVIDLVRAAAHRPVFESFDLNAVACYRVPEPKICFAQAEERAIIRDAIATLRQRISPVSFQAVQLGWLHGQSVQHVANSLGLTPAQVRYRQYRAKKKLRCLLKPG